MNKKITKNIEAYLLPKNTPKNCTPIGAIIHHTVKLPFKLSILMFYDYRTSRIERHLINSEQDINPANWNKNRQEVFIYENTKFLVNHTDEHLSNYENAWNPILTDGNLSQPFFNQFLFELLRDYLFTLTTEGYGISYLDTNMDQIRRITHPVTFIKNKALETGNISEAEKTLLHETTNFKLKNIDSHKSEQFVNSDLTLTKLIHIPKKFNNLVKDLNNKDIMFKPLESADKSQSLLDLNRILKNNFKDISHIREINSSIRTYNYNIGFKLKSLIKNKELITY